MNASQLEIFGRALHLKRTLGIRSAAGFLRNRGVPLRDALVLFGFIPRMPC